MLTIMTIMMHFHEYNAGQVYASESPFRNWDTLKIPEDCRLVLMSQISKPADHSVFPFVNLKTSHDYVR